MLNNSPEPPSDSDLARRLDQLWSGPGLGEPGKDRLIGGYRLLRPLGYGAFGVVYLAESVKSGDQVALKIPRPEVLFDADRSKRFAAEIFAASKLRHPGIVAIKETAETGPTPFIASEYCPGPSLADWLAKQPDQTDWKEVCQLIAQIADAVGHAHSQGVFHRDLKPENILLFPVDGDEQAIDGYLPRVTDFGLAKIADEAFSDTRSSLLIGTALYMAPEQIEGRDAAPAAADVYSLGVILFELLTKQMPVDGDNYLQLLDQTREGRRERLRRLRSDCPADLERIVSRCLAANPAARYESAGDLANDLRAVASDTIVQHQTLGWFQKLSYWAIQPKRIIDAGKFTLWSHLMLALWTSATCIGGFRIQSLNLEEHASTVLEVVFIVLAMHLPTAWVGWKTTLRRKWAIWTGLVLSLFNLPAPLLSLIFGPLLFKAAYSNQPFLSFGMYFMVLMCFTVQTVLYACAMAAIRRSNLSATAKHTLT